MRTAFSTLIFLLLMAPGAAQTPEPAAPWEASVRLVYESDTRAYYRPCG